MLDRYGISITKLMMQFILMYLFFVGSLVPYGTVLHKTDSRRFANQSRP